jgi:hypothetical protein
MINIKTTFGDSDYASSVLKAFKAQGGLGFQVSQDPGCYYQFCAEVENGITRIIWEFGILGQRVIASGYITGCHIEYRLQYNGSRGGYSETIFADISSLYRTIDQAVEAIERIRTGEKESIQRVITRWGDAYQDTPEHNRRVAQQAGCSQEIGITPCLVID